ncbi:MAG: transcription termination/antitermination protein NusA, partial [Elusimicrobiales bacterium]|nr:transcription termination/antitermination protein NusA [Elusimicrobiales bacterium]
MKGQSDLMLALEQLEREKGIKKEEILQTVSDALVSALRKYFGKTAQIVAGIDPESGEMMGYLVKTIVEEVNTSDLEITLAEAEKIYSDVKMGEEIEIPVDIKDFSRIAAQTAKQVLIQKIREIEKSVLYDEFKPREGEIVTGLVHHIVG